MVYFGNYLQFVKEEPSERERWDMGITRILFFLKPEEQDSVDKIVEDFYQMVNESEEFKENKGIEDDPQVFEGELLYSTSSVGREIAVSLDYEVLEETAERIKQSNAEVPDDFKQELSSYVLESYLMNLFYKHEINPEMPRKNNITSLINRCHAEKIETKELADELRAYITHDRLQQTSEYVLKANVPEEYKSEIAKQLASDLC